MMTCSVCGVGRLALPALLVLLPFAGVGSVQAATTTKTFTVSASVSLACSIDSTINIDFGAVVSPLVLDKDVIGGILVMCGTPAVAYQLALDKGLGVGATFAERKMTSTTNSADTLNYSLYTDATYGVVFGDGTSGSQTVGSSPIPGLTNIGVYGRLFKNQSPSAGLYRDTVTVTLSF